MVLSVTARKREPDITVIEVAGRVALGQERGRIEEAVLKALDEGAKKLVIDLAEVSYIDSTGIGIVANCFGRISQKGAQGAVAGAKGLVLEVFRLTRLDTVIHFYPDIAGACDSLTAASPSV